MVNETFTYGCIAVGNGHPSPSHFSSEQGSDMAKSSDIRFISPRAWRFPPVLPSTNNQWE